MSHAALVLPLAGLIIGFALGGTAARTDFCTFGGLLDQVRRRDGRRLRAWVLAAAVAALIAQAADLAGLVDLSGAFQRGPRLFWPGAVLGGALFGWGMTLTGGCGLRLLVRLGSGDRIALAALLTLGIAAFAAQRGLAAPLRQGLEAGAWDLAVPGLAGQGLPDLALAAGLSSFSAIAWPTAVVVLGLGGWALADRGFRASPHHLWSGMVIGTLVGVGWIVHGLLGVDEFDPQPLRSLSFVAPIGAALAYVMSSTGASPDFAVTSVVGTVAGAAVVFRLRRRGGAATSGNPHDLGRHLAGGAMMGVGGVLAGGCTIGQGLSGLSTLSLGAALSTAAIIAAAVAALRRGVRDQCGG